MSNEIPLLSSYGLICTFTGAEASLPHGSLAHGQGPFQPQAFQDSAKDSLPFRLLLPSASSWRMCSKATFAVCSGSPHSYWSSSPSPAQLPWEAQQEQHPASLRNCPRGSMAHTAKGWNNSFQQGKDVPALQGKALKGPKPKRSKILQ